MPTLLDITVALDARNQAMSLLADTSVSEPTLCLMKGGGTQEPEHRWGWGIYGPENIEGLTPEFARLGYPLLYEVDGLTVAIPQFHLLSELQGNTLTLEGHRLVVSPRTHAV